MFSSRLVLVVVCTCACGTASYDASPKDSRGDVKGNQEEDNSYARALKEEVPSRALDIDIELDDNATNETETLDTDTPETETLKNETSKTETPETDMGPPIDEVGCSGDEEKDCCRLFVEEGEMWTCASKKAEGDEGMDEAYCELKKGTFCKESKVYKEPEPGQAKVSFSMDMEVGDATVEELQKDETFLDSLAETMMVKLNVVRSAVKVLIKEKVRRLTGAFRRLSTAITVDYEIAVDEEKADTIEAAVNDFSPEDVQSTLKEKLTEKGSDIAGSVAVKEVTKADVEVITARPTPRPTPKPTASPTESGATSGGSGGSSSSGSDGSSSGGSDGSSSGGSGGSSSSGSGGSSSSGSDGSSSSGSKGSISVSGDPTPSPPPDALNASSDSSALNASTNSTNPSTPSPPPAAPQRVAGKAASKSPISIVALLVALVAIGSAHVA